MLTGKVSGGHEETLVLISGRMSEVRRKVEDLRRGLVGLQPSEAEGEDRTVWQEMFVVEVVLRHQSAPPPTLQTPSLTRDLVESLEPARESVPPALDSPRAPLTQLADTD